MFGAGYRLLRRRRQRRGDPGPRRRLHHRDRQDACRTTTWWRPSQAFVDAAEGNAAISSIQPGFYKVRTEIPASNAVARLADPQNRVGKLVIPEGRQLDDIQDVKTNAVTKGIFALISQATCVNLDGEQNCVSVGRPEEGGGVRCAVGAFGPGVGGRTRSTALGNDHRRLEGLIAPGTWNIDPSAPPQDILATLIGASATQYEQGGLLDTAQGDEHVAVSDPDRRVAGSTGIEAG